MSASSANMIYPDWLFPGLNVCPRLAPSRTEHAVLDCQFLSEIQRTSRTEHAVLDCHFFV